MAFSETGYVKFAWTLRAESIGTTDSIFRTETRAVATDAIARARLRWYWAFLSPGIILIRWAILGPLKSEAERRVPTADQFREIMTAEGTSVTLSDNDIHERKAAGP